jgi:hypothetical protein
VIAHCKGFNCLASRLYKLLREGVVDVEGDRKKSTWYYIRPTGQRVLLSFSDRVP